MTKIVHAPIIVLMCLLLLLSCNQTQLVTLANTLGNAVARIADLQGKTEVATKLREDTALITAAIKDWKPGMPAGDIVRLVNNLIRDINLLPINDEYRPFIIFALGTAAHIIDVLTNGSPSASKLQTHVVITNPPSNDKEFRKMWDCIRSASPGVEKAPVL